MSESPSTTWVGGRLPFSVDVEGLEASEQLLTLWVELPALLVVGQWLEDLDDPDTTFVQTLSSAMSSPLVGAARRPTRVRVADEALAAELRTLSGVEVEVAPTPELDRVIKSLAAFVGTGSYFSDPLLTSEALGDFFEATAALYQQKPWELAEDNALLYVENEALGVSDSAISLTGGGTDVPGIALYPSYEDYEQMRDVLAGDEDSALEVSHSALYLLFADAEHTPEAMRAEVLAQPWKLGEPGRYPVLNRLLDGKPAPVLHTDVRVATVLARALQKFVAVHRDALEQYGELSVQESYPDGTGGETVLTLPHPEVDLAEFEEAPRADTLSEEGNPYALPLSNKELGLLERGLNKFSLHRLIGMLVGVASVPEPLAPSAWMALLTSPPKAASELEMKHVIGLMMQVYNDVVTRLSEWEIAGLVPVAEDVHACREWARGFASVCDEVELGEQTGEAIDTLFAIYVLAEKPAYLKVLDEHRGEVSREERTDEFRDLLGDAVSFLYDHWEKARAAAALPPAKKAEPIRVEPKTGRNDPCPCGSGKKFKKCHG